MSKIVSLLPVNSRHRDKIGFYSLFVYALNVAKIHGCSSVYSVCNIGKENISLAEDELKNSIKLLSLEPENWWEDTFLTKEFIQSFMYDLYVKNILQVSVQDTMRCKCGNVEYFSHINPRGGRKSLIRDGYAHCCGSEITNTRHLSLCTKQIPDIREMPTITPSWADIEVKCLAKKMANTSILVSRTSKRPFIVEMEGSKFWIDTDFIWGLYSHIMQLQNFTLEHLIVGQSGIMQVVRILACNEFLGIRTLRSIHLLPKITYIPSHGVKAMKDIVKQFGKNRVVNMLLWGALSGRKELSIDGSLLPNFSSKLTQDTEIFINRKFLMRHHF